MKVAGRFMAFVRVARFDVDDSDSLETKKWRPEGRHKVIQTCRKGSVEACSVRQ